MVKKKNKPVLRFSDFDGEWVTDKLGAISEFFSGGTPSTSEKKYYSGKIPFIKSGEINSDKTEQFINEVALKNSSAKEIIKGDLLYALYGATSGEVGISKLNGAINQAVLCIRSKLDNIFLYNYLRLNKEKIISTYLQGGQGNLSADIVKSFNISYPLLDEQQKIASFLSSVDERIQQLNRKKNLLEQYKKGVMQKIFSREIRFKDDKGKDFPEWEEKKLGKVIEEYKENSNEINQFEVLTSSNKGLMLQRDYYGENRITERDNTGFNVIPNGYITYRSRSDNGKFTLNINDLGFTGIISTYYPVFKIQGGSNIFFVEYLNFHWKVMSKYSVGTSQRVLAFNSLSSIKLKLPCEAEQIKIGSFFISIDQKINLVNTQLQKTQAWKKGLLQKMFV